MNMKLYQQDERPFALSPSNDVSSKYAFVESNQLIEKITSASGLSHLGTSWAKVRTRAEERTGRQKHLMVFGRDNGEGMRLLVTNGHEGNTSLKFDLGFFRAACANGIIVGDSVYSDKIVHRGTQDNIHRVIDDAMEHSIKLTQVVADMQACPIERKVKVSLAAHMAALRGHELRADEILRPKRFEDREENLWTQFNVAQEYGMRGGYRYICKDDEGKPITNRRGRVKRRAAVQVKSIDMTRKLNKGLFDKAMEVMAAY